MKEYERMKRLAKATAKLQDQTVALYKSADDTYKIVAVADLDINITPIEYISPY